MTAAVVDAGTETTADAPPGVLAAAELATATVSLTLVASSIRLFTDRGPLWRWVAVILAIHLIGAVTRRLRFRPVLSLLGYAAVGALVISWLYLPDTLTFGVPTGATIDAARVAVEDSFAAFRSLVAPVPPSTGFEIVLAVSFATFATFLQMASFRGGAPFQAAIPSAGAFLVVSIFALGRGSVVAAGCFAAAVLLHLSCHRTLRLAGDRWASPDRRPGAWSSIGAATAIAAAAALVGAVAGPLLPGAEEEAVLDLRSLGRNRPPLEIANPLVGVTNLLGERSDVEMFTVTTRSAQYWRLTALERYDPADGLWKTRRSYGDVRSGDQLQPDTAVRDPQLARFQVEIRGLPGIWFPSPYSAATVEADTELRYDADSGSVIAGGVTKVPALGYSVTALIPSPSAEEAPFWVDPSDVPEVYSTDPQLSSDVLAWLRAVEGSIPPQANLAERARALQEVFRDFDYDAGVDFSAEADPVLSFLRARRGFCQQFASVFAQMARVWGIPSRVGVGFTWGDDITPDDARPGERTLVVRGRNAHAWPELYLGPGYGWVAFEPTPGRGDPANTALTGVLPAQEPPLESTSTTTTTTPTDPAVVPPPPATTTTLPAPTEAAQPPAGSDASGSGWPAWARASASAAVAFVLLAFAVAARVWWVGARRSRRWAAATGPSEQVGLAWAEATDALARAGAPRFPAETPLEYASRLGAAPPFGEPDASADVAAVVEGLGVLAAAETARVHSGRDVPDEEAGAALEAATVIGDAARARLGRIARFRRLLGVRPAAAGGERPQTSSSRRIRSRARSEALFR